MKYRILLLIFPCFLCLVGITKAQDFEPGQQAQGYLDSKSVMVDYVTGIFHYKIPLFTLGSGDFQLPVSLDYSARGVREEDARGLIGYNWLLNTGGVVTRIIRGGIADEALYYGYLWAERGNHTTPLINDVTMVNKRERDGECDIFTAVFNGQTVSFIIKTDGNDQIYAEPLEQTNVRIECEYTYGRDIDGWIITDENGNRYIYRQKEWSVDILKEDAISFNGVRGKSYISSWYLNRIEPCNKKPIVFTYLAEVRESEKDQEGINSVWFHSGYKSKYSYGRNMRERVFDFSKYRDDFNVAIREARDYLNGFSLEMQLNNDLHIYIGNGEWIRNPNFEAGVEAINANFRIMGQVANFTSITNASNGLIQTLNQLISTYENASSHNARMAASWFRTAKSYVIQSLNEVNNNVSTKETSGGTAFKVKSPVVQSITCDGKIIEFEYNSLWGGMSLKRIKLTDVLKRVVSQVLLSVGDNMNYLSFLDKEGTEVKRIKFDYYKRPSGIDLVSDAWGYYRERLGDSDDGYLPFPDVTHSKIGSLKTITVPNGGEITVDYESNCFRYKNDFGGIRVKSLLVEDVKSNTRDTVYYRYPVNGYPVFTDCSNAEIISYGSFSDHVMHSRMKYRGMTYMNTGNNGLFYPYVQEIIRGKGTKAYLFNVASPSNPLAPHAFWLTGLPLAIATYDNSGNLKQIVKYKYSSDLSGTARGGYFVAIDTALNYKKVLPQVKAYEYYMDEEFLDRYYRNQGDIFLYRDGSSSYSINPYNDTYLPNIKPRTSVRIPNQTYYIRYGGKTLLKEQIEYRFETHVTDSATISDFSSKTTGTPYQRIEFFYDNIKGSGYPTRVMQTDARGELYTTVTKRVTEMGDGASPVFAKMKQKNILTPVVKEIHLKGDTIQVEKVSLYETLETGDALYIGLAQKYAFYPTSDKILSINSLTSPDASLFSHGQTNYLLEQTIDYRQSNQSYLPVGVQGNAENGVLCYDFNYGYVILKAKHATSQMVTAADLKKYDEEYSLRNKVNRLMRVYTLFSDFYEVCQGIDFARQSEEFREYYRSPGHHMMQDFIGVLASKKLMVLDEYNILIDSIYANDGRHMNEFCDKYMQLAREHPELIRLPEFVSNMHYLMTQGMMRDPDLFKYRNLKGQQEYLNYSETIKITMLPESKRLKLFVLTNGAGVVYYNIVHSGGSSSGSAQLVTTSGYSVQSFDLDLSSYENVTSVIVSKPSTNVAYVALLPANVPFEAISYNLDGSVFCKFDQNGRMELNEYDTAGRLIRVKDEHGNVIKEYQYNMVKLN